MIPKNWQGRWTFKYNIYIYVIIYFTIWLFNIAMENGPFIDGFPMKTSIYKGFSMAMLNEYYFWNCI